MDSLRRFLGDSPKNPRKLFVYRTFSHQEIRWKSLHFTLCSFISTVSFVLFLYAISWSYKRDCLHASIDILFYIMFYIINTMKKHQTLLYHVRTYKNVRYKKVLDLNLTHPCIVKTQNSLNFISLYHPPTIQQNVFFKSVAITIDAFCVQLVKYLFLYIYKEVSGAFSGIAYFFNNILFDLVLLFEKIASGHAFHYLLIKMCQSLRTNRQGLPENFVTLIFKVVFYIALCKFLCILSVPAVFFVKRVVTNFSKFTENI